MLLGKAQDPEGSTDAKMILRFGNFNKKIDVVRQIVKARLRLQPTNYGYGVLSNNNLSFKAYELLKIVTLDTDCDSLDPSFWDPSKTLAQWSGKIVFQDTMPLIELDLDTSIVRKWLVEQADTSRDTLMNGLMLMSDELCNVICQFSAASIEDQAKTRPSVVLTYLNQEGASDSMSAYTANDISVVCGPKAPDNFLTVQGAITYRSNLSFDISSIPPLSTIHHAELEMTLNQATSRYGSKGLDSLVRADFIYDTLSDGDFLISAYQGYRLPNTDRYRFPYLTSAVEFWTRRGGKGTLIFRPATTTDERIEVEKLTFYDLKADSLLRPKLKIIYSTRNINCGK
jgi:hypothetical protein